MSTLTTILLVEDNPIEAQRIRRMLAEGTLECEVTVAESLHEAELVLHETAFSLVLLDLSLPDSRGLETFERIHVAAPEMPVVVLTGLSDDQTGLEAMRAGAQDYLSKDGVDSGMLVRSVRYTLERRRADAAERQRKALQQALGAMEEVLAVVSHELRTPLAAQQLACEYLLSDDVPLEEQSRYLRMMQVQVQRMLDTITNILDAARMEKGAARWQWSAVDGGEVCAAALEAVSLLVEPGTVELSASVQPEGLRFRGDSEAIRRMLVNLLSNAVKHTRSGTIELSAREMIQDGCRWIRFEVRDSGRGISDDIAEKLGEAFALSSASGPLHKQGSGLGLAICRGIAGAHGGSLSFRSKTGKGTTFCAMIRADLTGAVTGILPRILREAA